MLHWLPEPPFRFSRLIGCFFSGPGAQSSASRCPACSRGDLVRSAPVILSVCWRRQHFSLAGLSPQTPGLYVLCLLHVSTRVCNSYRRFNISPTELLVSPFSTWLPGSLVRFSKQQVPLSIYCAGQSLESSLTLLSQRPPHHNLSSSLRDSVSKICSDRI